jgi:AcrR family transcriptional regulator
MLLSYINYHGCMARWEPDAQGRLLRAALDLFAEHGYEATTTAQIAERAGLTKTTLFRLFADKREIVFQGQARLVGLVKQGVEDASMDASASALMSNGLRVLAGAHTDEQRRTGRILDPILASSPELNERAISKRFAIASALEGALIARQVDRWQAGVLADLGIRAYYAGYDVWVASENSDPLVDHVLEQLKHLEAALERLAHDAALRR